MPAKISEYLKSLKDYHTMSPEQRIAANARTAAARTARLDAFHREASEYYRLKYLSLDTIRPVHTGPLIERINRALIK